MDASANTSFEWPEDVLGLADDARHEYNNRVNAHMQKALIPIPEARALYQANTVQRIVFEKHEFRVRTGSFIKFQKYNVALPYYAPDVVDILLQSLRAHTQEVQLVNVSFGFIHSTLVPDEYVFKYPSQNTFILKQYLKMTSIQHVELLRPYLDPEVVIKAIQDMFVEDYGYQVVALVSVQLAVMTNSFAIGNIIPRVCYDFDWLCGVVWPFLDKTTDGKCVYRAVAAHMFRQPYNLENVVNCVLHVAHTHALTVAQNRNEFDYFKTNQLEDLLCINIRWHDISGVELPCEYTDVIYTAKPRAWNSARIAHILLAGTHCAYIPDFNRFCRTVGYAVGCGSWAAREVEPLRPFVWLFEDFANDNMCLWRALAAHVKYGPSDTRGRVETYCLSVIQATANEFLGRWPEPFRAQTPQRNQFDLRDTAELELQLQINIRFYKLNGNVIDLDYSKTWFNCMAHILVHDSHCAYIHNLSGFLFATYTKSVVHRPLGFNYPAMHGNNYVGCGQWSAEIVDHYKDCVYFAEDAPNDNKCFWRAYSVLYGIGPHATAASTQRYATYMCSQLPLELRLDGEHKYKIDLTKNAELEQHLKKPIGWYNITGQAIDVRHAGLPLQPYGGYAFNLLLHNGHCALITQLHAFLAKAAGAPVASLCRFVGCGMFREAVMHQYGKYIRTFSYDTVPDDNMCAWRALACWSEAATSFGAVQKLATRIRDTLPTSLLAHVIANDNKFDLTKNDELEEHLKQSVCWYDASGCTVNVPHSTRVMHQQISILVDEGHCALIFDLQGFLLYPRTISEPEFQFVGCGKLKHKIQSELWHYIVAFQDYVDEDYMCVWRAIAAWSNCSFSMQSLQDTAEHIFETLPESIREESFEHFKMFNIARNAELEDHLNANIVWYNERGQQLKTTHSNAPTPYLMEICLMLCDEHCSYIKDLHEFLSHPRTAVDLACQFVGCGTWHDERIDDIKWYISAFAAYPDDNMCLWRALELFRNPSADSNTLQLAAMALYESLPNAIKRYCDSGKFNIAANADLEAALSMRINWFTPEGLDVLTSHALPQRYYQPFYTVNLVVHDGHCAWIHNLHGFLGHPRPPQLIADYSVGCGAYTATPFRQFEHCVHLFENSPVDDMCFWRAIAAYRIGADDVEAVQAEAQALYNKFPEQLRYSSPRQNRFPVAQTPFMEQLVEANICWYTYSGPLVKLQSRWYDGALRSSEHAKYEYTISLLADHGHCVLIHDLHEFRRLVLRTYQTTITAVMRALPRSFGEIDVMRHKCNPLSNGAHWSFDANMYKKYLPESLETQPNDGKSGWRALGCFLMKEPVWGTITPVNQKADEIIATLPRDIAPYLYNRLHLCDTHKLERFLKINIDYYNKHGQQIKIRGPDGKFGYSQHRNRRTASILIDNQNCSLILHVEEYKAMALYYTEQNDPRLGVPDKQTQLPYCVVGLCKPLKFERAALYEIGSGRAWTTADKPFLTEGPASLDEHDGKCFWRAVALHKVPAGNDMIQFYRNVENVADELCDRLPPLLRLAPPHTNKVRLCDTLWLEIMLLTRINWYRPSGELIRPDQPFEVRGRHTYDDEINLLVHDAHCVYINNLADFLSAAPLQLSAVQNDDRMPIGRNWDVLALEPKPYLTTFSHMRDVFGMCFWRAIAAYLFEKECYEWWPGEQWFGEDDIGICLMAEKLWFEFPSRFCYAMPDHCKFNLRHNAVVERMFNLHIKWYQQSGQEIFVDHHTQDPDADENEDRELVTRLLLHNTHCAYINDFEAFKTDAADKPQISHDNQNFYNVKIGHGADEPYTACAHYLKLFPAHLTTNDMCVWRALAAHVSQFLRGQISAESRLFVQIDWSDVGLCRSAFDMFRRYARGAIQPNGHKICLAQNAHIEQRLLMRIRWYDIAGREIQVPHVADTPIFAVMNTHEHYEARLFLHEAHCLFITNFDAFIRDTPNRIATMSVPRQLRSNALHLQLIGAHNELDMLLGTNQDYCKTFPHHSVGNHMCFWRALATHVWVLIDRLALRQYVRAPSASDDNVCATAQVLYSRWPALVRHAPPNEHKIALAQNPELERVFNMYIEWFDIGANAIPVSHGIQRPAPETSILNQQQWVRLVLHKGHCLYITDFAGFVRNYRHRLRALTEFPQTDLEHHRQLIGSSAAVARTVGNCAIESYCKIFQHNDSAGNDMCAWRALAWHHLAVLHPVIEFEDLSTVPPANERVYATAERLYQYVRVNSSPQLEDRQFSLHSNAHVERILRLRLRWFNIRGNELDIPHHVNDRGFCPAWPTVRLYVHEGHCLFITDWVLFQCTRRAWLPRVGRASNSAAFASVGAYCKTFAEQSNDDDMCAWRALAWHKLTRIDQTPQAVAERVVRGNAEDLYQRIRWKIYPEPERKFCLHRNADIEWFTKFTIRWYNINGDEIVVDHYLGVPVLSSEARLFVHDGHCVYITDWVLFMQNRQQRLDVFPALSAESSEHVLDQPVGRTRWSSFTSYCKTFPYDGTDMGAWRAIAWHYLKIYDPTHQYHTLLHVDRVADELYGRVCINSCPTPTTRKYSLHNNAQIEAILDFQIRWYDNHGVEILVGHHGRWNYKTLQYCQLRLVQLFVHAGHCEYITDLAVFKQPQNWSSRIALFGEQPRQTDAQVLAQPVGRAAGWPFASVALYCKTFVEYEDDMCAWRAFAWHGLTKICTDSPIPTDSVVCRVAEQMYRHVNRQAAGLPGRRISLLKNCEIEMCVDFPIRWYNIHGHEIIVNHYHFSGQNAKPEARLFVHDGHCVYITDWYVFRHSRMERLAVFPAVSSIQTVLNQPVGRWSIFDQPAIYGNHIWTFPNSPDDGKCVYRALAAHFEQSNAPETIDLLTNRLMQLVPASLRPAPPDQNKFDLRHTKELEHCLNINIQWFHYLGRMYKLKRTRRNYNNTAHLFVHKRHCAYIHDVVGFKKAAVELFWTNEDGTMNTRFFRKVELPARYNVVGCGDYWKTQPVIRGGNCWTFTRAPADNKCFARCLAALILESSHCNAGLAAATNRLLREANQRHLTLAPPRQNELDLQKVKLIEEWLHVHIRICFDTRIVKCDSLSYSPQKFDSIVHLLMRDNHYAVISNLNAFQKQYLCHECQKNFSTHRAMVLHGARCDRSQVQPAKWKFIGGLDRPKPDMLTAAQHVATQLAGLDTSRFTQRFVFFDIESCLSTPNAESYTPNELLRVEQEHIPVSIALAYSGDRRQVQNPTCFVSIGDPQALVTKFHNELLKIYREQHVWYQFHDYKPVLEALEAHAVALERNIPADKRIAHTLVRKFGAAVPDEGYESDDDDENDSMTVSPGHEEQQQMTTSETVRLRRSLSMIYNLLRYYDKRAYQLNVVGYNISKYDLNVLKRYLVPLMLDDSLQAVKRQNRYLVLSNKNIRFTDIYLFVAPTTNFDKFCQAYMRAEDHQWLNFDRKLDFPYEWLTGVDVLQQTQVPPPDFFTSMSRKNYLECSSDDTKKLVYTKAVEKRDRCLAQFKQLGCRTMQDFLIAYNKADVAPGVLAVENMLRIYKQTTHQELFDFITLPSAAKCIALHFTSPGGYFMRFKKMHEQIYHDVRTAIVGGTSIVWTRLAEAGVSKIRPHEFGEAAMTVQRVIGLDMSGCYLYATSQEHLTGPYFIRNESNNFKIENDLRNIHSVLAIEYYVRTEHGAEALARLQHQFKGGERQFITPTGHTYSVDGYFDLNGLRYAIEYFGCYYHNHVDGCTLPHRENTRFDKDEQNFRMQQIRQQVDNIYVIHECKWYNALRQPKVKQFCAEHALYNTWQRRKAIAHADIVPLIMKDQLKGLFEVDAYVPKCKRDDFHDVQPFFCQYDITWDMIGDTMRAQLAAVGRKFTKPHRLLVNPPFCEKQFLTHYYIKWLVEHGIVVHRVYRIIEYPLCTAPFRELGELICRERQKAASASATEEDKASADSWKLIGNSIYGQFCMAPDKFTRTSFMSEKALAKIFLRYKLTGVEQLANDLYEVTHLNTKVTVKQCPQMAVGVYQHAKLRMLAFEYDLSRLLDRKMYCLVLTDTDSYYLALAAPEWESCVRADVTKHDVDQFKQRYFCMSPDKSKYMGLFHVEFEGHTIIALQPKMYFACGDNVAKTATRGIGKRDNPLDITLFRNMLSSAERACEQGDQEEEQRDSHKIAQRSFRVLNAGIVTIKATTSAFNAYYFKRKVLPNNIDTADLDWKWPDQFSQ